MDQAIRGRAGTSCTSTTMADSIGAVYTELGEVGKAQEWIEKAAIDGFPNYTFFEHDVHLERLRAVPEFRAFLSKLRQEWEHIPGEPD